MVKFLLLSQPRTGSRLLCSLLNSHPAIGCTHESCKAPEHRNESVFTQISLECPGKSVLVAHAHHGFLTDELRELDVPKIVLTRKDYVRASLSAIFMNIPRAQGFRAKQSIVNAMIEARKASDAALMKYADFVIDYSEFADNNAQTSRVELSSLLSFLGVAQATLTTTAIRSPFVEPCNLAELYG